MCAPLQRQSIPDPPFHGEQIFNRALSATTLLIIVVNMKNVFPIAKHHQEIREYHMRSAVLLSACSFLYCKLSSPMSRSISGQSLCAYLFYLPLSVFCDFVSKCFYQSWIIAHQDLTEFSWLYVQGAGFPKAPWLLTCFRYFSNFSPLKIHCFVLDFFMLHNFQFRN